MTVWSVWRSALRLRRRARRVVDPPAPRRPTSGGSGSVAGSPSRAAATRGPAVEIDEVASPAPGSRCRSPQRHRRVVEATPRGRDDSSSVPICWVMKPTSRSRSIGMIGFCTAPSRASATSRTGGLERGRELPRHHGARPDARARGGPAATASERAVNWERVSPRPWSSTRTARRAAHSRPLDERPVGPLRHAPTTPPGVLGARRAQQLHGPGRPGRDGS